MTRTVERNKMMQDCIDMIRMIYRHDPIGGDCHVVLDDGNLSDDDIIDCIDGGVTTKVSIALETLDPKIPFYLTEYSCLMLLLKMTDEEREECRQKGLYEDGGY